MYDFNPRSSCEERQFSDCRRRSPPSFQSTLLMRGATASCRSAHRGRHFNPRSSCEERRGSIPVNKTVTDFNPRSSCEERLRWCSAAASRGHFNPRSSCEERPASVRTSCRTSYFNPRSSCEERQDKPGPKYQPIIFQSTLLMRGATQSTRSIGFFLIFQSTLLMRGATAASISFSSAPSRFQSTLLMRGATGHHAVVLVEADISIHAPHARSDLCRLTVNSKLFYFNPRSSCEERHAVLLAFVFNALISIHAPHARSDTEV